ncbi:hypothetical protein PZA11_002705 [Diplocarpon coronariae]
MLYPLSILSLLLLALIHLSSGHDSRYSDGDGDSDSDPHAPRHPAVPFATRAFWMRRASEALAEQGSPCPFAAFGTVIVNHTDLSDGPRGRAVCYGVNSQRETGNPTLHGEIVGINNCSAILTDPAGEHRLTPAEALAAFATLSLYTNAEPCPMVLVLPRGVRQGRRSAEQHETGPERLDERDGSLLSLAVRRGLPVPERVPANE